MHELINKLAFSLLKKNSLEECSLEEVESLVKKYPYFSPAQLLLAAKQKQTRHPDFGKQLNITSLHVNNTIWLDHLLDNEPLKGKLVVEEKIQVDEVLVEPNNDELVLEKSRHELISSSGIREKPIDVSQPLPVIEKAKPKEEPMVFEPYYTVDYFASQGIKNISEEKPKDRLTQQLKSFTEWLKTIRQMPAQEIAAMSDAPSEQKVVELASHSIVDRNVETEAMAEVWIKQGNPEKAVEIYHKLSLLNPSKSSYFASLIENLKKP